MSVKFRLDRKIGFQITFYTKCINVIIDSIGPLRVYIWNCLEIHKRDIHKGLILCPSTLQDVVSGIRTRRFDNIRKLEDLKVLRRSPDLLNNAKIGQGQLQLILFYHIWRLQPFWSSDLNNLMNNPSNSPLISEKKMFK